MFEPGILRDYRCHLNAGNAVVTRYNYTTILPEITVNETLGIYFGDDAGEKLELNFVTYLPSGSATGFYYLELDYVGTSTLIPVTAGFKALDLDVEIDASLLDVSGASYTWSYDEIRIYFDNVLIHTISSGSVNGGYEPKNNYLRSLFQLEINPEPSYAYPACSGSFASQGIYEDHVTINSFSTGYTYLNDGDTSWSQDDIIVEEQTPLTGDCGCETWWANFEGVTSNNVTTDDTPYLKSSLEKEYLGIIGPCYCENDPDKTIVPAYWEAWLLDRFFHKEQGEIHITSKYRNLRDTHRYKNIECCEQLEPECTGLTVDTDTIEEFAYCELLWSSRTLSSLNRCEIIYGPPSQCELEDPPGIETFTPPDPDTCSPYLDTICRATATNTLLWNGPYDFEGMNPELVYDSMSNLYLASENGGSINLYHSYTPHAPFAHVNSIITPGQSPTMLLTSLDRIEIWFIDGTAVRYSYCDNWGNGGAATPVLWRSVGGMVRATAGKPGTSEALVVVSVYNSGTSGPSKLKVRYRDIGDAAFSSEVTAKDSLGADLEIEGNDFDVIYSQDGMDTFLLFAKAAGASTFSQFLSNDNGETWNEKAL